MEIINMLEAAALKMLFYAAFFLALKFVVWSVEAYPPKSSDTLYATFATIVVTGKTGKSKQGPGTFSQSTQACIMLGYLFFGMHQQWQLKQLKYIFTLDSHFLKFTNSLVELTLSSVLMVYFGSDKGAAPIHLYVIPSFTNVLASWFSNESYGFGLSVPVNSVLKQTKLLPTMFMHKIVNKKNLGQTKVVRALIIVCGAALFTLSTQRQKEIAAPTMGLLMMLGYLCAAAVTRPYQHKIQKQFKGSWYSEMRGMSLVACLFTLFDLLRAGTLHSTVSSLASNGDFLTQFVITCLISTCFKLCLYQLFSTLDPIKCTLAQLILKVLTICADWTILSNLSLTGVVGLCVVFAALIQGSYTDIYRAKQQQSIKSKAA